MKKVTKFQTQDNQIFDSEFDAKSHEWFIRFKGLIQQGSKGAVNFNVADAANAIKSNPEVFRNELNRYIDFKRRNSKSKD